MFPENLHYETKLIKKGRRYIAGVDEAGRGPWAGPIVVAAVVLDYAKLPTEYPINNDVLSGFDDRLYWKINDSKKLTENAREELYDFVIAICKTYTIIEISHEEIDQKGISETNKNGFYTAIAGLAKKPDHILTDYFPVMGIASERQTNIPKGDRLSLTVGAASILAKVHRDRIMRKYGEKFPRYGFEKHKGYGTKAHREAICKYGLCEIHRRSFAPMKVLHTF